MVALDATPTLDGPCPRVVVTVTGLSAGEHEITVWRTSDGERNPVRGARDVPVVDSTFFTDFEAPLGRTITYELEVLSGPDSGSPTVFSSTSLDAECGYIQDPFDPSSAVPVWGSNRGGQTTLRPDAFSKMTYAAQSSTFRVMGARLPVSITSARSAVSGIPLQWRVRAESENIRLRDLVQNAPHLVIRPLPGWGARIPATATYLAGSVEETKVIKGHVGNALTQWETTGELVRASSARVVIALWAYQDVAEIFATYAQKQVSASGGTYLDDQKNPSG